MSLALWKPFVLLRLIMQIVLTNPVRIASGPFLLKDTAKASAAMTRLPSAYRLETVFVTPVTFMEVQA